MSVEITITGFPQAVAGITVLSREALPEAIKTLQELGKEIAEEGRANAPVRTGRLKASIQDKPLTDGSTVEASAPYAGFVEFGTSRMVGRAFLSKAVDQAVNRLIATYEAKLV